MTSHLHVVHKLAEALGPAHFWTRADPQMIVIVLMADISPKAPKGKAKEGEQAIVNVKLGRYAVLVESIKALLTVDEPAGSGSRLRTFAEVVEARLGVQLEAEEKEGSLPGWYRALLCMLFFRLRSITKSLKR